MKTFINQYIDTALWSSTNELTDQPLDSDYSRNDLSEETLKTMTEDCTSFVDANSDLLERACEATGNNMEQAAHDFWLTRNGHGAGFWDGNWNEYGDELTEQAEAFSEVNLYVGNDNQIYSN